MDSRTITGAVLTAALGFLMGWLAFGVLLMDFTAAQVKPYPGLIKQMPDLWAVGLANLLFGSLLAYVFRKSGTRTAAGGLVAGLIVSFLVMCMFDLYIYAQMDLYSGTYFVVDVLANTLMGGVSGAFLGWWLGRKG